MCIAILTTENLWSNFQFVNHYNQIGYIHWSILRACQLLGGSFDRLLTNFDRLFTNS